MVDLSEVPDQYTPTAADFELKVGNSDDPDAWMLAPAPVAQTFPVARGAGTAGSDRITIIWEDHAIRNQWLQVTVLAGTPLGLPADDVFYFGNAVAEAGKSDGDAQVTTADLLLARNNLRNFMCPAAIDFKYDYNRDQRVNAIDVLLARNNQTNFLNRLKLIDLSGETGRGDADKSATPVVVAGDLAGASGPSDALPARWLWLYEHDQLNRQERPCKKLRPAEQAVEKLLSGYDWWSPAPTSPFPPLALLLFPAGSRSVAAGGG